MGELFEFELIDLLKIHDGTFIFDSRDELKRGAQVSYNTFKSLGLSIHNVIQGTRHKSKSEAMYISPSLKYYNDPSSNVQRTTIKLDQRSHYFLNRV